MSQAEYKAMINSGGRVQESISGTTHVANPASSTAFKASDPGTLYVEFDIPVESLRKTSSTWAKILGPNSLEGRFAAGKGLLVPQMPTATNIIVKEVKP